MAANSIYPSLKGRVVIVTGGGQGLGRCYAQHFAQQGAIPVIAEYNEEKARAVQREIEAEGHRALAIPTDVSRPDSVAEMAEKTLAAFGRIDVLLNNAALLQQITMGPFWELPLAEWQRALDVNVTGAFLCARAVLPAMKEARWGRIINFSSSTALMGRANYLHYVTTKSALIGMTRAMAREVGPWNITVNVFFPGLTRTEVERPSASGDHFERMAKEQSIQRVSRMEDQARCLLFLCSDDAGYLSGQSMQPDGGRYFI